MENPKGRINLSDRTTKYIIFICIGLVLIIAGGSFSGGGKSEGVEVRLAEILSEIDGVGETRVMLNFDKNEEVSGAIIVSKGASDVYIKQKITTAVSAVLGISSNKIEVFEKN